MNLHSRVHRYLYLAISACCLFSSDVVAAPTLEQLQQAIQSNISLYKAAASKMSNARSNPLDTNMASVWQELDELDKTSAGNILLTRATAPKDNKELVDISTWLKWKILSENADARYSYAYSSNLSHMKDKNGGYELEAAVYLFLARLSLAIDGARCVDKASPDSVGLEYEMSMQPIVELINQAPKRAKAIAILEAVSIELMRGERKPIEDLCMRGGRTVSKALELGRELEPANLPSADTVKQLGVHATIDTSGLKPEFIPENEWLLKRKSVLDTYLRTAIEML